MKIVRWFLVALLIFGLILVRKFETDLFYDPLLSFFHQDFMHATFPEIDIPKHFLSVFFRYFLNAIISLGIIYFIFQDVKIVRLSALILFILFFVFLLPYYYFIHTEFKQFLTAGFYIRRLLIQPVMLLILIPAIWFYKKNNENKLS